MKTALTIAGSDSSGGAGIQADLKTMTLNGVYAMSVLTALTAQNTLGVTGILPVPQAFLVQQMDAVFSDIPPDAVKIGMVASAPLIEAIGERLRFYGAKHIVVDPVMVSTSGSRLLDGGAETTLTRVLFPLAEVITPNLPEAEVLSHRTIRREEDMEAAAQAIYEAYGCAVLCKGGHRVSDANDYLWDGTAGQWFRGERIHNPNTHGTGCTLSSAMAANLAKGFSLADSVRRAKTYLSGALGAMLDLGQGAGPMDHGFALPAPWREEGPLYQGGRWGLAVPEGTLRVGGALTVPRGAAPRGPACPAGVPISPEKWGERGPGASPLDPRFYGPLAAARSFWRLCHIVPVMGLFRRPSSYPDLGTFFHKMLFQHIFYSKMRPKSVLAYRRKQPLERIRDNNRQNERVGTSGP